MNERRRLIRKEAKKLGTSLMFSRVKDYTLEELVKRRKKFLIRYENDYIHKILKRRKYKGIKLKRKPKMRVKIKRKK